MTLYCPICNCELDEEEHKEAVENLRKVIEEREEALKSGAKEL